MNSIKILPETLINKIAAGEVVERPCSVVKELVENSIDSGAKSIQATIKSGGKELISILDDGCGMSREEALTCVERHATSKIKDVGDLDRIQTMGFRGEALAAIASVSKFEITTCKDENEGGTLLQMEGGKILQTVKTGFPLGTRIKVEELFFNTPARLKFLKGETVEFQKIQEFFLNIALSHPGIHLRLNNNKKETFNLTKAKNLEERIFQIYGAEFAKDLVPFSYEEPSLKLEGVFSRPTAGRPSKRWQQLFVNNRSVKAPFVNHAVGESYKTILMKHLHPMFFLKLEIKPEDIDVNVHPAKTEIRFKNQTLVYTIIVQALQRFLKDEARKRFGVSPPPALSPGGENSAGKKSFSERPPSFENALPGEVSRSSQPRIDFCEGQPEESPARPSNRREFQNEARTSENLTNEKSEKADDLFHFTVENEQREMREIPDTERITWKAIGEFNEYILAAHGERLLIVDKHAAHERIRFEEIRNQYFDGKIKSIGKALPEIITLAPQDAIKIENYMDFWNKIGFEIEHFGKNDFKIKAIPIIFQNADVSEIIRNVLDETALFGKSGNMEKYCNQVFEKMACHSAIRGKQSMALPEMQALLDQLTGMDINYYCPHGRPVVIELESKELEKRFKRVV